MKIGPIQSLIVNNPVPLEKAMTGRFPLTMEDGYIIVRVTHSVDGWETYGLMAFVFPESYETIRPHEDVIQDKIAAKELDIPSSTMVSNPVCLLYDHQTNPITEAIAEGFDRGKVIIHFQKDDLRYEYVLCDLSDWTRKMAGFLEELDHLVIADGHHRTAAYFSIRERSKSDFGLFAALLPLDQIHIHSYHRKITLDPECHDAFMDFLRTQYHMEKVDQAHPVTRRREGDHASGGIYFLHRNQWRKLLPVPGKATIRPGSADLLDHFERYIFTPFCDMHNLSVQDHLQYVAGEDLEFNHRKFNDREFFFTFPPVDPQFLWNASMRGEIMPAKSTWIEPRMASEIIQVPNQYE